MASGPHLDRHGGPRAGGLREVDADLDLLAPEVRAELERLHEPRRTGLEVDRLPQASRRAVPLLPFQLERVGRIVHADDETVLTPGPYRTGELQLERGVAALVGPQGLPVEPGGGLPVRRPDAEEDPLPLPALGYAHRARVPAHVALVGHPREGRAPGEGHGDGGREGRGLQVEPTLFLAGSRRVEAKAPRPVQVQPLDPLEAGTRVLGQGDVLLGGCGEASRYRQQGHGREEKQGHTVSSKDLRGRTASASTAPGWALSGASFPDLAREAGLAEAVRVGRRLLPGLPRLVLRRAGGGGGRLRRGGDGRLRRGLRPGRPGLLLVLAEAAVLVLLPRPPQGQGSLRPRLGSKSLASAPTLPRAPGRRQRPRPERPEQPPPT